MNKAEMQIYLVNNMCLPFAKLKSNLYRRTLTNQREDAYLKDEIRRLNNHGDKFHPYF